MAHGREIFQELFSALLARESHILRQGNRERQNKTKPNQTSLLQTAASSPLPAGWLAGWLGWLLLLIQLLMALQKNRMAAGQKRSSNSNRSNRRSSSSSRSHRASPDIIHHSFRLHQTSSISPGENHRRSSNIHRRINPYHPSFIHRRSSDIHRRSSIIPPQSMGFPSSLFFLFSFSFSFFQNFLFCLL